MKARFAFCLSLVLCMLLGSVVISHSAEKSADAKKPYWKIAGHLEEACKCSPACPCWFGEKPTHMNCGGQLVYFITKGRYEETPLDGLAWARMSQSPDGRSMVESYGNYIFDYLYIDEKANPEQRKAIEAIAVTVEPRSAADLRVQYVPISRVVEGKMHHIKVGNVGSFSAHLIESVNGETPKLTNSPWADPVRYEYQQGVTTEFRYTDASQNWNTKNSNYMYNNFEVDSVQYEKHDELVAKKMENMKKEETTTHHKHCSRQ